VIKVLFLRRKTKKKKGRGEKGKNKGGFIYFLGLGKPR